MESPEKGSNYITESLQRAIVAQPYLQDIPPFEAELIVCGGFEIVFGDGFHGRGQQWWGRTGKALPESVPG